MAVVKELIKCPFCFEPINAKATRCKHCHADLTGGSARKKSPADRYNNFRFGFLVGVLFSIIMAILIYLQFSPQP
jgi:hypothetical protein